MGEVNVSPELLSEMEALPDAVRVVAQSMLDRVVESFDGATVIGSTVWNAEDQRVDMDVLVRPVLTNVNIEIRVP